MKQKKGKTKLDTNPPSQLIDNTPQIQTDHSHDQSNAKKLKFGKSFWRNPAALAFVVVFAAIGAFLIFKSFAATGSYTWDTSAQWAASSASGGPYLPTFANTMINKNVGNGIVSLAQATGATDNLALHGPVTTSKAADANQKAANVTDGSTSSQWVSAASDPGWVYVDLGAIYAIRDVKVTWGSNYATAYHIDGANANPDTSTSWTPLWSGAGGRNTTIDSSISSGSARYIRIYGTHRHSSRSGYAIAEVSVNALPTYQPSGGYSVIYNAGQSVKWTSFTDAITLSGGSISYSFCTADTATLAATGPWTSCSYNPTDLSGLVNSQYLKINTGFSTPHVTATPTIDSMTINWASGTSTPPPPPSDTTKPNVSITLPANGSTVSGNVVLSASASDNVGVTKVTYTDNGSSIPGGTVTTLPYSVTWATTSVSNGSHTIQAVAYDAAGNVSTPASVTVTVNNTVAPPPPTLACQSIAIPAYFYPSTNSPWSAAASPTAIVSGVGIMIANPSNGPGSSADSSYKTAINNAKSKGIRVFGYVDTSYTNFSLATVEANVNSWKNFYGVTDIFFDDVATTNEAYYQTLSTYVHQQTAGSQTMLNPGTLTDESYINAGDIISVFEGTYTSFQTATVSQAWMLNYPASHFYAIVYATPDSASMTQALLKAEQNHIGNVYATNDNLPNPWDTVPSYMSAEANQAKANCSL